MSMTDKRLLSGRSCPQLVGLHKGDIFFFLVRIHIITSTLASEITDGFPRSPAAPSPVTNLPRTVSGAFFNLPSSNWREEVVPLIGALSWRDLIRSNDQINGEFQERTLGD